MQSYDFFRFLRKFAPMRPTIEYVKTRFDEFNRTIFGGRLPKVTIRLSRARSFLGQLAYKKVRGRGGQVCFDGFTLKISVLIDRDQEIIDDTILHEMIHLEILYGQKHDTSAHGIIFRERMAQINREYGRHISISHKATATEQASDTRSRVHVIGRVTLHDGTRGILVPAHTRINTFRAMMARHPQVASIEWITTTDPSYNRYPRTLTPKLYKTP